MGPWIGKPPAIPFTVKAKPGYVVAGMNIRAALGIDGFALTYMKLGKDRLDTEDSYEDPYIGSKGGRPSQIGGSGAFVVGIVGHLKNNGTTCALGFVVAAKGKSPKSPSDQVLVISDDMFPYLQKAVRDDRWAEVDLRGYTGTKNKFRQISPDGGLLIGFEIGFIDNNVTAPIESLRPIFLTADGEKMGTWIGNPPSVPVTVKAKPGYVVAGVNFRAGLGMDGFALIYMKLSRDRLETADSYTDPHVGSMGGNPSKIGGTGAFVIGIFGHQGDSGNTCALGFVVAAKE